MIDARARAQLERLARSMEPRLQEAWLRAVRQLRDLADVETAIRRLPVGDVDGAIDALLAGEPQADNTLREALQEVFTQGGRTTMRADVPAKLQFIFTAGAPAAAKLMTQLDLSLFPAMRAEMEAGLREALVFGLENGLNPRTLIPQVRPFVGLTEYDFRIMRSFRRQLTEDPARALARMLRDKRFDKTLARVMAGEKTLSSAQIADMSAAYNRKLLQWRSEAWSRTATLQSVRAGQMAAWQQVVKDSGIAPDRVVKRWVTTLDGRERPAHHEAHGTTVLLDEPFPVDGGVQIPGEGVFNCRCTFTVRLLPRNTERRTAFLAALNERGPVFLPTGD